MLRARTWTVAAAAAVGLVTAAATTASAADPTQTPYTASDGTATVSGATWIIDNPIPETPDLGISGTLSNTGTGCFAVWTKATFDWSVGPTTEQVQICGAGSADFNATQYLNFAAHVWVEVCKGTANTNSCGAQVEVL
jgi:hypothetical protein